MRLHVMCLPHGSGTGNIIVPKRFAAITDEVLRREAGMLDDDVRILPQQMAILTGLSVDALKERRRTGPPKPPHPEPRERAGGAIWYSMGSVRQADSRGLRETVTLIPDSKSDRY